MEADLIIISISLVFTMASKAQIMIPTCREQATHIRTFSWKPGVNLKLNDASVRRLDELEWQH